MLISWLAPTESSKFLGCSTFTYSSRFYSILPIHSLYQLLLLSLALNSIFISIKQCSTATESCGNKCLIMTSMFCVRWSLVREPPLWLMMFLREEGNIQVQRTAVLKASLSLILSSMQSKPLVPSDRAALSIFLMRTATIILIKVRALACNFQSQSLYTNSTTTPNALIAAAAMSAVYPNSSFLLRVTDI